jgi:ribosomal protein S18 acetylase RimI-like enzyme
MLFSQCILELRDDANRGRMSRNGFGHVADLLFMQRPLDAPLPGQILPLQSLSFDEWLRGRFASVVDRTYQASLDCPAVRGVRTAAEMLDTHQAAGNFDPARWRIYQSAGSDVGVLLLGDDYPESDNWEVLYLGVVPEARGQGWGRAILLDGLQQARRGHAEALCITVDSQNTYAIAVYEQLAFARVMLRAVHLRIGVRR